MIREAHDRKVRVEIVFTSFGSARNKQLFGGTVASQDKVIASLVAFAHDLGVDGINVDVELMDPEFVPGVRRVRRTPADRAARATPAGGRCPWRPPRTSTARRWRRRPRRPAPTGSS